MKKDERNIKLTLIFCLAFGLLGLTLAEVFHRPIFTLMSLWAVVGEAIYLIWNI